MNMYEEWDLSQLYDYLHNLDETARKSISHEARLTEVSTTLRPALSAALKRYRLLTLARLMDFRRKLIPLVPFYFWARDIVIELPKYEAEVLTQADPAIPIRALLDRLASHIHEVRSGRQKALEEIPEIEYLIRLKTAKMLQRREKMERER